MKKKSVYLLCIVILCSIFSPNVIHAAPKKVFLELSNGVTYYGEVKDGKPNGKGSMNWGGGKSYSGDWINGKRSGQGYYKHQIVEGDTKTTITYKGSWKNDRKNGKGQSVEVTLGDYGPVSVEQGTFNNNQLIKGYSGQFYMGYYNFYYESDKQFVGFGTNSKEQTLRLLSGDFSGERAFSITNIIKNGKYYEGYNFGYEPESAGSHIQIGTYGEVTEGQETYIAFRNGVENTYGDGTEYYTHEIYKDGKSVKKKFIYQPDEYYETLNKNLQIKLKDIKPYLKGFTNIMKELENSISLSK